MDARRRDRAQAHGLVALMLGATLLLAIPVLAFLALGFLLLGL